MVKHVDQRFQQLRMTSLDILFGPQPENTNVALTEEERNLKIFTFKNLESVKVLTPSWKNYSHR